jgi:starch phosphorylase
MADTYFHLADFDSYLATQQQVSERYLDKKAWNKSAIENVARVGKFSSDRTIRQYASDIWGVEPVL